MEQAAQARQPEQGVALLVVAGILSLSLLLQHEFNLKQALLFLTGVGLGITLLHAAFGFSGGWRTFIRERRSASVRAQLLLLMLSSLLFFPLLGNVFANISVAPALAPVGVSVLVGAFLFGIGMQLGGGCGSGTLFTVGQGQVDMLITLSFFIVGATLGSVHLPWWMALPAQDEISMIGELGWAPALVMQLVVLAALYLLVRRMEQNRHGEIVALHANTTSVGFIQQLLHGPWPLWWGVVGLAGLGLVTLLLAGHPWSITFAFGLWGSKLWAALGGDVSQWSYWSSGYANKALNSSVLADVTSVMDFGIMLGAMLAAALAGKYAPPGKLKKKRVLTAIAGGLLLGYGARLAFGCNIGALLGGIASGSLHGWLWLIAAFVGAMVGVRLRVWLHLDRDYAHTAGAKA